MKRHVRGLTVFAAMLVAGTLVLAGPSGAENNPIDTFKDALSKLLRGSEDEQAPPPSDDPAPERKQTRVPLGRGEIQLSFAPLVRQTAPAVVNVYAARHVRVRSPFAGDPFFEQFFGRQMPPRIQSSLGSGVIIDPAGLIVTNNHVIRDADEVKVALPDGREFECKILLKDDRVDVAVLKIDGREPFPFVAFGDSDALETGDLVLAIGNPFGVGQTTTSGIVSALARNGVGISDFGFFIQTDAAINPGNSGGALIDMAGRLIGINSAIYSRSGGSNGIGFAIPSNMVRAVVGAARAGEDFFERPFIGASFEPMTAAAAESLGLDRPQGALVSSVYKGGPADEAGLIPGDVVLELDGAVIEHPDALGYRLDTRPAGSVVALEVLRRGTRKTLEVRLSRPPGDDPESALLIKGSGPLAGVKVAEASPRLAQRLGMRGDAKGVVIVEIDRGSPASQSGLQPGDIIRQVNEQDIRTPDELAQVAKQRSRWWQLTVERNGHILKQMFRF